jgi:hypothetical protein
VARIAPNGGVLPCYWSATVLPLRDACVDVVVVDLPFNIVHKVKGGVRALYARAFGECARVMRPGARLVALATSRRALCEPLAARAALWEEVRTVHVNNGGAFTWVLCAVRTHAPPQDDERHGKRQKEGTAPAAAAGAAAEVDADDAPLVASDARRGGAARGGGAVVAAARSVEVARRAREQRAAAKGHETDEVRRAREQRTAAYREQKHLRALTRRQARRDEAAVSSVAGRPWAQTAALALAAVSLAVVLGVRWRRRSTS